MPGSAEYQREWATENREHLREYHKQWRAKNAEKVRGYARNSHEKHRDKQLVYMRERKQRNRRRIEWIKRMRGCIDCGTKKGKLEFDHRPDEIKVFNVAQGVGYSWAKIKAEIDKCDVRCGKCHRTRHMILRRENGTAPWMSRRVLAERST